MKRVACIALFGLAALAPLARSAPAAASAPTVPYTYGILSLVGDHLRVTTYVMSTGSQLDRNTHVDIPTPEASFDKTVLLATADALAAAKPKSEPVYLWARDMKLHGIDARNLHDQSSAWLFEALKPVVQEVEMDRLVIVLRHRGPARVEWDNSHVGSGRLEGLGFYLDRSLMRADGSGDTKEGLIAPFVYARLMLIDPKEWKVLNQVAITRGRAMSSLRDVVPMHPWDRLSADDKAHAIEHMLKEELARAVPLVLAER